MNNVGVSPSGHDEAGARGADAQRLEVALATIKDMFGVDYPIEPGPGEPSNARDLNTLMTTHAFTDSWARPGLDRRTKSIATLAMMIAMGQGKELRNHVSGSLMLGVTKEEIVELLIHALAYVGAPRTAAAWENVQKVFSR